MRARFVVPLVLVALLACGRAEAGPSGRAKYSLVLTAIGLLQAACFGSATYLRLTAPNADTLMTFKREATVESDLFVVCGILTIPVIAVSVLGGFTLLRDSDRRTARADDPPRGRLIPSLMVTGSGAGVGLGGSF